MQTSNYQKMEAESGQKFMILTEEDTELKMDLENAKARQLYEMIKEQDPTRYQEMKENQTLVPFLNKITNYYHEQMRIHISNGANLSQVEELESLNLIKAAGL